MGILVFTLAAVIGYQLSRESVAARRSLAALFGSASALLAAFRLAADYHGAGVSDSAHLLARTGLPLLLAALFILAVALGVGLAEYLAGRRRTPGPEAGH